MKQQLIPKPRRRKRQPSAAVMREQLRLAADEIIRLRSAMDGVKFATWSPRIGSHYPPERNPPPPPPPPRNRDVTGRNYQRPWWRRIFRSKAA